MTTRHVLLIDGDTASLRFLTQAIKQAGHEVSTATSGKEGLIAAWRNLPDTIILDPALNDIGVKDFLAKLRQDPRTAHAQLVAFYNPYISGGKQALRDLAFDRLIEKSPDSLGELQSLLGTGDKKDAKTIRQTAQPFLSEPMPWQKEASEDGGGKLVVFLSAKGGVGTSTICANLATVFAEMRPDDDVSVVDLVLPLGSIATITGYKGGLNIVNVVANTGELAQGAFLHNLLPEMGLWKFKLLAGSPDPRLAYEFNVGRMPHLVSALRAAYDFTFVDLGRSLSRISLPIIKQAEVLVLLLGSDETTVIQTRRVMNFLESEQVSKEKLVPLINRAVGLEGLNRFQIEEMLDVKILGNIPYMGGNFALANNLHVPISYKFPDDTVTISLREASQELERRLVPQVQPW